MADASSGGRNGPVIERLIIGVPTVRRVYDYLPAAIDSLTRGLEPGDASRVSIILMNADMDPAGHTAMSDVLRTHADAVASGLLRVITAPAYIPGPEETDGPNWYRKQTFDAASLFAIGGREGSHYLHLEDDIVAAPGYVAVIEDWLQTCRARGFTGVPWFYYVRHPEWAEHYPADRFFGTFAMVLTPAEAAEVASFMFEHLGEAPSDMLFQQWLIETGRELHVRLPSIFQHVGAISSQDGEFEWNDAQVFAGPTRRLARSTFREAWAATRVSPVMGARLLLRRLLPSAGRRLMYRVAGVFWWARRQVRPRK